ncbi:MAG: ribosome-associated translation inhibitor RaiA [Thermoanaerobaculia bacterium]|nr:ribosome-associated translation inhibitor RaiA [Thermoanaerobaculia bacterium]
MNVEFTARHYHLDEEIKDYASKKLEKLEPFLEEPADIHLILETEKIRQIAELIVSHRHGVFQATEEAEDMRDAVHAVIGKVEKQARRSRKKYMDQRRRADRQVNDNWPVEVLESQTFGRGERPRVIKRNHLPIKPMTIDEASLRLEQSKNDFFVFRDSASDRVSVLYRRKDENYGLIAPEF